MRIMFENSYNFACISLESDEYINSVVYNKRKKLILTGSSRGILRTCDLNGIILGTKKMGNDTELGPMSNPQGTFAAFTEKKAKGVLKVQGLGNNQHLNTGNDFDIIKKISWSNSGQYIAIGKDDLSIDILNCEISQRSIFRNPNNLSVDGHESEAIDVSWSDDDTHLLAGTRDGHCIIWNLENHIRMNVLGHDGPVITTAWHPNNMVFASSSTDGAIRIWNLNGKHMKTYYDFDTPPNCLKWSPKGDFLAASNKNGVINIISIHENYVKTIEPIKGQITSIFWTDDGRYLCSSSNRQNLLLFDISYLVYRRMEEIRDLIIKS